MDNSQSEIFVGSRQFQVADKDIGISFPVLVQYPTHQTPMSTTFGPYIMEVAPDAKIIEGQFPLVIISHGNSGSHLLYRTISTYLAKNGFIVAMLEHYGNNRQNNELGNSVENLQYRPKHVSLTIDNLLANYNLREHIKTNKIAVIGHSFGGYTALALAGGIPWTQARQKVEVSPDKRVKALILMAPAADWFIPSNSLEKVNIPILLLTAEHDKFTPEHNTEIILNGILDKSLITYRLIENAGHFSFISPFPATMKSPNFLPSTDPEGFDRDKFHTHLPKDILIFLSEKLTIN